MIIKTADDKTPYLQSLEALAARPDVDVALRKQIEQDIRFARAGMQAERDAAYEIDFNYGQSQNWVVLHDLRLEHSGRVAQIDHILMNRLLECYVLETKSFSEGVSINEYGEFTQFFMGRPRGIASPVEQNNKHILVLNSLFGSASLPLPTRLGVSLRPACHGLVVVSRGARISRPRKEVPGVNSIVKMDQLSSRLDKEGESSGSLLRLVSRETLQDLAQRLARLHVSAPLPTAARYGLPDMPVREAAVAKSSAVAVPELPLPAEPGPCQQCGGRLSEAEARYCQVNPDKFNSKLLCRGCQRSGPTTAPVKASAPAPESSPPASVKTAKYTCATCSEPVDYAVARFCWLNKQRFGGQVYCREHQSSR